MGHWKKTRKIKKAPKQRPVLTALIVTLVLLILGYIIFQWLTQNWADAFAAPSDY